MCLHFTESMMSKLSSENDWSLYTKRRPSFQSGYESHAIFPIRVYSMFPSLSQSCDVYIGICTATEISRENGARFHARSQGIAEQLNTRGVIDTCKRHTYISGELVRRKQAKTCYRHAVEKLSTCPLWPPSHFHLISPLLHHPPTTHQGWVTHWQMLIPAVHPSILPLLHPYTPTSLHYLQLIPSHYLSQIPNSIFHTPDPTRPDSVWMILTL